MSYLSTREAAKKLGIAHNTLAQYIRVGKIPAPQSVATGSATVHLWTEEEIEHVRKLLPKLANGRKTRWQRQRETEKKKQSKAKTKTWPGAAAVRKRKKK
jgi:predicted DNA-binding transcriptional regulator AlpA